ncbi:MAG: HAMP domain-containing protein [Sterolibacterium sp.]|jgi:signal transduction histidine kinase|nr:HAMP domain-containing protein [Sterolibacterium sp.]
MPDLLPFQTLRGKLVFFACFATLPAFIFVLSVATNERAAALEKAQVESLYVAESASREHAHQVEGARRLLETLSALHLEGEGAVQLPVLLPAILSGFPQFANIGALTPEGELAYSVVPPPGHISMARLPVFQEALSSRQVAIGTYLVGLIVQRPILIMARSLRDLAGKPNHVLFIALDLAWLNQLARSVSLPPGNALLIVDRDGNVLASSMPEETAPVAHRTLQGMAQLLSQPGTLSRVQTPDGIHRMAVARPLEGLPGIWVVIATPEERVYDIANDIFLRDLVVLALLTVIAILSSLVATDFSVLKDIRALSRATRRFGSGELTVRVAVPPAEGEIRNLALAFNTMADVRAQHYQANRLAQDRLRALTHQLQHAREEEAARIAQELHDELGQELSVMRLELERLMRCIQVNDDCIECKTLLNLIDEFGARIDAAVRSVRRISSELRPGVLDRLGLQAGLEWLLSQFERRTGIAARLQATGHMHQIQHGERDSDISTALFRITQEALTNVARHSGASWVTTELQMEAHQVLLMIRDNGKGFDVAGKFSQPSLGVLGMQERAGRLGGTFDLISAPGQGTVLRVTLPRHPLDGENKA